MSNGNGACVIRLEHVFKSFGSQEVLNDVSLDVPEGKAFGIVGRSGTGKSVTLNLMIGLLRPDRGRVLVRDKDLSSVDRKTLLDLRKGIGYLFQNAALFDSMTVQDNVAFPLRRHTKKSGSEIRDAVKQVLDEVGLGEDAGKLPGQLSGGMQKRVGLARALVMDPSVILVDEPSSGLDVITASEIYDLLKSLKNRGKTLVVVTHDGSATRGMADELAVLDEGHVIAIGPPAELAKNDNDLVRALVSGEER